MMQTFPKRIKFLADDNEAILLREEKTKSGKIPIGWYQYVVSKTKLGREMPMELEYIEKLIGFDILEIMEK